MQSIEKAASDRYEQWLEWRAGQHASTEATHPVRATDAVIDRIEEINLSGHGRDVDVRIPGLVRELERDLGRRSPSAVRKARTWVALHGALLDWQDELLDEASPTRHAVGDDGGGLRDGPFWAKAS